MRWVFVALICASALSPACDCNHHHTNGNGPDAYNCTPACTGSDVCRYDMCVPPPTPCTANKDCPGDDYCDTSASECLPWGVGPGGANDPTCKRTPVPGVFFPGAQCEWLGPPANDPYPNHVNVLATPMVATFYAAGEFSSPSIVFTSYNYTDGGPQSCESSDPTNYYGVIRIIDGRTCQQQATIASPTVVASASVAVADIGGIDATPEIVAPRSGGGLVAWTLKPSGWEILWQTTSTFGGTLCDWAGPSIHDLDDDGIPEILFYGNVYDANGNALDESLGATVATGTGYIPIAADIDGDGQVELVTGSEIYGWDKTAKHWTPKQALANMPGHLAVADFGTYPQSGTDDRSTLDGVAEIALIRAGVAYVYNIYGRLVFSANLQGTTPGSGGPPTIADFDGDGRVEFASAGATAYAVFDPDCQGTPDPHFCPSMTTNGVAWFDPSQDLSSNVTGSSVFDFDGDGRAEVIYGDECFTRVYDGVTGKVLYSRYRTSCTWYENPVVADVDADFNAEIVSTSNTNCSVSCPAVDPIFDGVQCHDDADCPRSTTCGREQATDMLGRCRCAQDSDCGGDGFVCLDPIAGPSAAGKVCRASHPATAAATGVRVLADSLDRWVNTRTIWNQHAYSVTNIDQTGKVPRTSQWLQNWKQMGLNNFRQNTPGDGETAGDIPDLTIQQAKVTCDTSGPVVTAAVCDRGTEPVAPGLPVAVYDSAMMLRCTGQTTERLNPGFCTAVSCTWTGGNGTGSVVADDKGDGRGIVFECREDNNSIAIDVECP
jgi:hypothetical protein